METYYYPKLMSNNIIIIILYLYAPEFIKEQNLTRLAENRIIKYCFSEYPGKDIDYSIFC